MVARKKRTAVVLDTNVFARNFKARDKRSANRRVVRLWLLEKRLQLIVSREIIEEYLEIFAEIVGLDRATVEQWRRRFEDDGRSTMVQLGRRFRESRDPDDNVLLAAAFAGEAEFLLSNDKDLLELPAAFQRTLPLAILSPQAFLQQFDEP